MGICGPCVMGPCGDAGLRGIQQYGSRSKQQVESGEVGSLVGRFG